MSDEWAQGVREALWDWCENCAVGYSGLERMLAAAGAKIVPAEPTVDMEIAGTEAWLVIAAMEDRAAVIWNAMLAAAPSLEPKP